MGVVLRHLITVPVLTPHPTILIITQVLTMLGPRTPRRVGVQLEGPPFFPALVDLQLVLEVTRADLHQVRVRQ